MARMKQVYMEIEELCYEAMERSFTNVDDVFAYVNTYSKYATRSWVEQILEKFHNNDDSDYQEA